MHESTKPPYHPLRLRLAIMSPILFSSFSLASVVIRSGLAHVAMTRKTFSSTLAERGTESS